MANKQRNKNFFNILVFLLIILAIIIFLKKYQGKFNYLQNLSLSYFVVLSIFSWISAIINGFRVKVFAKIFNIKLSFKEWFGLSQITTMGAYITPFHGSSSIRAIYLKKKYKFPYKTFMVTIAATAIISFFAYSVLGLFSIVYALLFANNWNVILFIIFLAMLIVSLIFFFFPHEIFYNIFRKGFIGDNVRKLIDGWSTIKKYPKNIMYLCIIEILFIVNFSFSLFFAFKAINYQFPFIYCLIVSLVSNLSILFSITPAGLGVREAVTIWSSSLFGAGLVIPLNVAILVRLISIVWVIPFGAFFSYILFKK